MNDDDVAKVAEAARDRDTDRYMDGLTPRERVERERRIEAFYPDGLVRVPRSDLREIKKVVDDFEALLNKVPRKSDEDIPEGMMIEIAMRSGALLGKCGALLTIAKTINGEI